MSSIDSIFIVSSENENIEWSEEIWKKSSTLTHIRQDLPDDKNFVPCSFESALLKSIGNLVNSIDENMKNDSHTREYFKNITKIESRGNVFGNLRNKIKFPGWLEVWMESYIRSNDDQLKSLTSLLTVSNFFDFSMCESCICHYYAIKLNRLIKENSDVIREFARDKNNSEIKLGKMVDIVYTINDMFGIENDIEHEELKNRLVQFKPWFHSENI